MHVPQLPVPPHALLVVSSCRGRRPSADEGDDAERRVMNDHQDASNEVLFGQHQRLLAAKSLFSLVTQEAATANVEKL